MGGATCARRRAVISSVPSAENVPDDQNSALEFAEAEIRSALSLKGRISSSGPHFVFGAEYRLQDRVSSSRPNFVFRAEFRLQGPISSSGPNFVFAAECRLQGRISRLQRSTPERRTLSNSVFGPNFPNQISSSQEFRLHGRFSSSHFVFAHNLSFSSLRTISVSKASEFRLQGGGRNRDPLSPVNSFWAGRHVPANGMCGSGHISSSKTSSWPFWRYSSMRSMSPEKQAPHHV